MANRAEVGVAYVRLLPSMQGFTGVAAKGIKDAVESAGEEAGDAGGEAAGTGFMDKLKDKLSNAAGVAGKILGKTAKYAGFAGAAVSGLIAKAGITRLVGLENANKSLQQMGMSSKQIDKLMDRLLVTLRGTPYALNEGAGALAAMVSSGAPLKRVGKYMDMIADSAAFAQAPFAEVARVFQKIQSQGKIQGDEVMSLAEMGLPAFQILAKGTGRSIDDLRDRMKEGKVTASEFFDGWEKGSKGFGKLGIKIEGAAKSAGDTTEGALSNMRAAAGRLGAMILGTPFSNTKGFFNGITRMLDDTTAKLRPFVTRVNELLEVGAKKAKAIAVPILLDAKDAIAKVDWAGIGKKIKDKFGELGRPIADGFRTAVETGDFSPVGKALGSALGDVMSKGAGMTLDIAGSFGQFLANVDWFKLGRKVGKEAIGFGLGLVIGLISDTDWGKLGKQLWDARGAVIMGVLFVTPIGKAIGAAGKLLGKIPFVGKLLGPLVTGFGKAFTKVFGGLNKLAGKGFKTVGRGISAGVTRVFPALGTKISQLWKWLKTTVSSRIAGLIIEVKKWFQRLPGVIGRWIEKLVAKGAEMVSKFVLAIGKGGKKIFDKVKQWPGRAIAALAGAATALVASGEALVGGFLEGIANKATELPGTIKDKVVNAGKRAFEGITGFDIHSPSKVTERYGEYVAYGFAEGLRNGAKDTRDALHDLIAKLKEDGRTGTLGLVTGIQASLTKKLKARDLLGTLDEVPTKLDKARDKLSDLKSTATSFKDSVKSGFRELADITSLEVNNFAEMLSTMRNSKKQAATFTAVLAKLQKMGLNKTTLDQLYAAGPDALKNAQMLLSGGKNGINQINQLVTGKGGILASGNVAASQGYKLFYQAGVESAQGLLDGLIAKHKELDAAIRKLSNSLVAELKKQLGIKSPSTVFRALGMYVPAGFAEGILGGTPGVLTAMQRMIATPSIAQVSASSLPGLPAQLPAGVGYSSLKSATEPTQVFISGEGLNRKLLEWLREAVRVEGGDVQQVIGTGTGSGGRKK